ncbi:MAG: biopolymer transporter ExbD [Phycisphaerales bacterium]
MRFRPFQHDAPTGKINVTPLIDVVMVLIVFYLIVGRLATQTQGRVQLPQTASGETAQASGVVIAVSPAADPISPVNILIDGRPTPLSAVKDTLTARMPELAAGTAPAIPVQLRADRSLSYGDLAPIVQACREAGLTNLELVSTRGAGGGQ